MFGKNKEKNDRSSIREERFKRVASRRVQEILNKLRLLGNCSDKANYSYNDEQIKKIFGTIDEDLKIVKTRFKITKSKENKFKLE